MHALGSRPKNGIFTVRRNVRGGGGGQSLGPDCKHMWKLNKKDYQEIPHRTPSRQGPDSISWTFLEQLIPGNLI